MPRKVSEVWEFFKKTDSSEVICNLCEKKLSYSGGTTNLRDHLTRAHKTTFSTEDNKQTKITDHTQSFKPRILSQSFKDGAISVLANQIINDLQPMKSINDVGFKATIAHFCPEYKVPDKNTVKKVIMKKHRDGLEKLKCMLAGQKIALTSDHWTSIKMESYITISCHFINEAWELLHYILETNTMHEKHTAVNTASRLNDTVSNFVDTDNVVGITKDNAAYMSLAVKILNKDYQWNSLDVDCMGHTINLCMKSALNIEEIADILSSCKQLVCHFKHSTVALVELKVQQTALNLPLHKLQQECKTRWNSTLDMVERLIEQRWAISKVLSNNRITKTQDRKLDLNSEQWGILEELVVVLKPFKEATEIISGELYVTYSQIYPTVAKLKMAVTHDDTDSDCITQAKDKILMELNKRFGEGTSEEKYTSSLIASLLDQRFKRLKFLPLEEKERIKNEVVKLAKKSIDTTPCEPPPSKRARFDDDTASVVSSGSYFDNSSTDDDDEDLDVPLSLSSTHHIAVGEVDNYLKLPKLARRENPLLWWKENENKFPNISKLARSYLCIPASSTTSERVFSKAGNLVTKKRSSLSGSTVDALIFLNKNKTHI